MLSKTTLATAAFTLSATAATAQESASMDAVLTQANLSPSMANEIATAAIDACAKIDQTAVVAVVDCGGNLVAVQRGDNVGPHNTEAAQRKAFTALSTKTKSGDLAEIARNDASSQNLTTVDDLLLLGGGVPVRLGDDVIGAVGVAGAGGSANDESCAVEAIEAALND